ncbi:MBL fold metallo-hydrolase [Deinococcus altitudinis]|uniref:MBL fold metallo-hydrolase n=1 Tax=Deinococcus altitudinis TaxID=468914 RepID=UPI003892C88E
MTTTEPSTPSAAAIPARPSRLVTSGGARIYTLTLDAFPHFAVNTFLVVIGEASAPIYAALIDTGSSHPDSTAGLEAGLAAVQATWGEQVSWDSLSRVIVTHAHPDHVAGLPFVRGRTRAPVAAHALDVPTIENPFAARDAAALQVEDQIRWAGIPDQKEGEPGGAVEAGPGYATRLRRRSRNPMSPEGVQVETVLRGGELLDGHFRVIYTPGHQGAQICLLVHDVLLSADHLLPHNSPPLMPERAQPGAGLTHYLASLDRVEALSGVRVALGGHGGPMHDWGGRIGQLRARYQDKLQAVLAAASEALTVHDLTLRLYPQISQVQALLLLDQTGALVEYLVRQGDLDEVNPAAAMPGASEPALFRTAQRRNQREKDQRQKV